LISLLTLGACAAEPMPEPAEPAEAAPAPAPFDGDAIPTDSGDLIIHPISHATFAMGWDGKTIYVDPVGGGAAFEALPPADLILITDIHGDHLNAETLEAVTSASTQIVAPQAVIDQLPEAVAAAAQLMANGEEMDLLDLTIEAIPMYNLTEDRLGYHEPGRGNGYVVTMGGQRVYISGDTEDIPEMRALENIDVAFVCFNLPFTMTEDQAASAVVEFAPRIVYPYHDMGSDVDAFAALVGEAEGIEVRVGGWY
jgi:L-ascorbate metabolism protein UlaG (beta-lactamase superfamily)